MRRIDAHIAIMGRDIGYFVKESSRLDLILVSPELLCQRATWCCLISY